MATQRVAVKVPPGMVAGQGIQFCAPGGATFTATIPQGVRPGGTFLVEVAAAAAPSIAQAQPMFAPAGQSAAGAASFVPMGLPVDDEPLPSYPAVPSRPAAPPRAQSYYNCLTPSASAPSSTAPPSTSPPSTSRPTAVKHAECPICFEPLHQAPVGVFLDSEDRRISRHFFNVAAAQEWLRSGTGMCPMTRAPIASVLAVPSIIDDPDGWFGAVDIDGDGRLSVLEVVECLKAQLPVDNSALDAAASDTNHWMWQQWDSDGSGFIERDELLQPQGLAAYVRTAFAQHEQRGPPDIKADKDAWYEFWDEDRSGSLDKEEVVRALLKTLRMTHEPLQVQMMRGTIEAVWCIFDEDGSGCIERDEFLRPGDGLADTIIATVEHG